MQKLREEEKKTTRILIVANKVAVVASKTVCYWLCTRINLFFRPFGLPEVWMWYKLVCSGENTSCSTYIYSTLRSLSQQRFSLICHQSSFYVYFIIRFIWSVPSPLTADVLNLGVLHKLCEGTRTHSLFCMGSFTQKWQGLGLWTYPLQAAVCPLIFLRTSCCSSPSLKMQPFTLVMPFFWSKCREKRGLPL